ncbi:MAG TPA: bile acid:sodium symporter family protein [Bacteroidales bacterium]|nr:bile acid:sodium symporter family protein [Bacteroidales bacterium]
MIKKLYFVLLALSVLAFAGAVICYYADSKSLTGPLMIAAFALLAFAVRGFEMFRGISYTLWIFTAVTASMFYPAPFTTVGGFQLRKMIVPLLQVIMFGMGSQMSFNDFAGVIRMPKGVIIGVLLQFTIMPLVGLGIANLFSFPPEIAAGIILIGCVPSGLASNVMSYLARANLALAVTISAVTTLLSPLITPTLMKWLGGQFIEVNFWSMMLDILNMIILPIVAGFTFNLLFRNTEKARNKVIQLASYAIIIFGTNLIFMKVNQTGLAGFLRAFLISLGWFYFLPMAAAIVLRYFTSGENSWMDKVLSMVSMVGIAMIVAVITAAGRNSLLDVGALLLLTSLLHNLAGYTLGYSFAWLSGMPERDRRTLAFEVGMQNGGLASGLALQMGKVATVGLAPAIFGPLMNITGSVLANWWRGRPAEKENAVS